MTDQQALLLLSLVAAARSHPNEPSRFGYVRDRPTEGLKVRINHAALAGTVEVLLSDVKALAREGLITIDYEDSVFGMIDLTPAGIRAADGLGQESGGGAR